MAFASPRVPDATAATWVGSTFEAAGAADKLRDEIGDMFRDGTLAATMAKYSYYGLESEWATYDLMEAAERARWVAWSCQRTRHRAGGHPLASGIPAPAQAV